MTTAHMLRSTLCLGLLAGLAAGAAAQSADAEARFSTGVAHLKEGRFDLAIEDLKKAVKQEPKNPYFQKGLGQAYTQKGRSLPPAEKERALKFYEDAIEALHKALELNPYYVDVHNDLGSVLLLAGKREEGKREFLSAFGDPQNPTPEISAYNLGEAYIGEQNYAEAVNWYRTSLGRNKSWGLPYLGVADALDAQGRAEESIAQLEIGVNEIPEDPALPLALGQRYLKAGRFTDARAKFEAALKKDPGGPVGQRAAAALKDLPK